MIMSRGHDDKAQIEGVTTFDRSFTGSVPTTPRHYDKHSGKWLPEPVDISPTKAYSSPNSLTSTLKVCSLNVDVLLGSFPNLQSKWATQSDYLDNLYSSISHLSFTNKNIPEPNDVKTVRSWLVIKSNSAHAPLALRPHTVIFSPPQAAGIPPQLTHWDSC